METTYYTFTANEIIVTGDGVRQVSGGEGRRMVCLRRGCPAAPAAVPGSNVVDFTAWRAAHAQPSAVEREQEEDCSVEYAHTERYAPSVVRPARAARGIWLDLTASLALIAAAVSACVSFLL